MVTEGKNRTALWLKLLLGIAGFTCLLIVSVAIFIRTQTFRDIVREQIVVAASENLNGTLHIGALEGDFFSNVSALDISLVSNGKRVLRLPRLEIQFGLWGLLKNEIHIHKIFIDSLEVSLFQISDSTWNLNTLLVPSTDTTTTEFTWLLILDDLEIHDANVAISALDTSSFIPKRIQNINCNFAAVYSNSIMDFKLQKFRLQTVRPNLTLDELSFYTETKGEDLFVRDFTIRTPRNRVDASATIGLMNDATARAHIKLDSLDFSEFRWAMPETRVNRRPSFEADIWFGHDSLHTETTIVEDKQEFLTNFGIGDMSLLQARYWLESNVRNIDVGSWLNDTTLTTNLNGQLRGSWIGTSVEQASFMFAAKLAQSTVAHRRLDTLFVNIAGDRGTIHAKLKLDGQLGSLDAKATISDVGNTQSFDVSGTTQNLNVGALMLNDTLHSNLSMQFSANGAGFSPENMRATVRVALDSSAVAGAIIHRGIAQIQIERNRYTIDTLDLQSSTGNFRAAGVVDLDGVSDLQFEATIASLVPLTSVAGADTLLGSVTVNGFVRGKKDSLNIDGRAGFGRIQYNNIRVDTIDASFDLQLREHLDGTFATLARNVNTGTMLLDSININGELSDEPWKFGVTFRGENELRGAITMTYDLDSVRTRIVFPEVMLGYKEQELRGGSDSMWIEITKNLYNVHHVALASENQELSAHGLFSTTENENLRVSIRNLNLADILQAANVGQKAGGVFDGSLELNGTASSPEVNGTLSITNGFINALQYQSLTCSLTYAAEQLHWTSDLTITPGAKLLSRGIVPLNLAFNNTGEVLLEDRPMQAELKSEGLTLNILQAGADEVTADGAVEIDLKLKNTLAAPEAVGHVSISNGKIEYPEYGIEYTDAQFRLDLTNDSLWLSRFELKSGDGSLHGSGRMMFGGGRIGSTIRSANIDFTANNFILANGDEFEMEIDGRARLGGDIKNPEYDGEMTIVKSRIWLPKFTNQMSGDKARTSVPLLVAATRHVDTSASKQPSEEKEETYQLDYLKNLHGKMKLSIPKNTWLRTPDMQVEISGDMEIEKSGEDFELFGEIRTVRGTYEVLGKRFEIASGSLFFQGGKENNPDLDIEADYTFRDEERNERVLKLHITGKAFSPKLDFSLDEKGISLSDAVAYLTFGRSFSSLSLGQKSSASEQGIALGLAAKQLTSVIGRATGLDVLEIRGGETIGQTSIAVGKYISSDLFMSVEKRFGSGQSDNSPAQIVTLEYELTKFLFLQLIQGDEKKSGFDVFVKLEK